MLDLFSLSHKNAVITGASGALGGAIAEGLARAGANVALCYGRNKDAVKALQVSLAGSTIQTGIYRMDVLDHAEIRTCAEQIMSDFGRIDILVNAAGGNVAAAITGPGKTFFDLEIEPLKQAVELNFLGGVLWPCLMFGRQMISNPDGGSIINISSMNAFRPLEGRPAYAAAKAAVNNFTQWLACHIAKECNPNIRVNAIAPGFFPNSRTLRILFNEDSSYTKRGQKIINHTPMGRFGRPEELIGACIWYASAASGFVTGTVTPVDGGFNAYAGV